LIEDQEQNRPDDTPDEGAPVEEPAAEAPEEAQPAAEADQPAPDADEPAPEAEDPAPEAEEPAAEPTAEAEDAAADAPDEEAPAAEEPDAEQPAAEADEAPAEEAPRRTGRERKEPKEEVIPGAHLEPDLVLEEERQRQEGEFGEYAAPDADEDTEGAGVDGDGATAEAQPVERKALDLAADARYIATGKRKSAVARVILKPGDGTYTVNGKELGAFFPRPRLQVMAKQPLETAGYESRMDVVAKIHGGGVSSQATALRHGIARALVEADPALRAELKRKGFLTRDPRVKERKKAGLKKARKRPQFSKR
jgi:small subunit ribosomal protein S9